MIGRRIAALVLGALAIGAAWGVAPGALAQSPTPEAPAPGSVSVTMPECHEAVDQASRTVTFAAEMTAEPRTQHMEVRVRLLARSGARAPQRVVHAPGLSLWRRSELGVQVYRYLKQIVNLPAPASYQADVSFRWLDAQEHTIRSADRRTPTCEQHDPRARLTLGPVTAQAGPGASADYAVEVHNGGRGPSPATELLVRVDGAAQPLLSVPALAAGARSQITARAPRCRPGGSVHLVLDPARRVDEAPGGGRPRTAPCPAVLAGAAPTAGAPAGSASVRPTV